MADRVPKQLIREIKVRLDEMELESILSSGYLQPFLENRRSCLFDTVGTTQRPDVLCAKLLEGRVGLLIEGTPFALVIPKLFCESFQTMDDYCYRPAYATLVRWIKYAAFLVAILLPALYVAIALHHPELLNRTLLLILAEAEENAPISLTAEAIGVLLVYEIIREAGLRLPKAVGGAVSIVAGLIIGDAAVSSGLISTPMLTVTAIAVIAGFVVPDLAQSITLLRLAFLLTAGVLGLFGISLLGAVVLFNLCAGESFGFPITAPFAPLYRKGFRDTLTRVSFRKMQSGRLRSNQIFAILLVSAAFPLLCRTDAFTIEGIFGAAIAAVVQLLLCLPMLRLYHTSFSFCDYARKHRILPLFFLAYLLIQGGISFVRLQSTSQDIALPFSGKFLAAHLLRLCFPKLRYTSTVCLLLMLGISWGASAVTVPDFASLAFLGILVLLIPGLLLFLPERRRQAT